MLAREVLAGLLECFCELDRRIQHYNDYVDDVIDAMVRMMRTDRGVTGSVNIGNATEVSMLALAEKVLTVTESRSRIRFAPLPPDDPRQRRPDLALANQRLDWQLTVGLDDGLKKTIAHFRRALSV